MPSGSSSSSYGFQTAVSCGCGAGPSDAPPNPNPNPSNCGGVRPGTGEALFGTCRASLGQENAAYNMDFGDSLQYSSFGTDSGGSTYGWGWSNPYQVELIISGSEITYSQGNGGSFVFQNNGGSYTASYFEQDQLTYNSSTNQYLVTKPGGEQELFSSTGQLLAKMDAYGNVMSFTYNSSGVLASAVTGSGSGMVGYYYTFDTSYRQTGVVLRVGGSTSAYNVRQVLYAYDTSGNLVQVQLQGIDPTGGGWVTLKYAYFRYYTGTSLLKYAVEDDAYRQICAANGQLPGQPPPTSLTWLQAASDATIAGYADNYFAYDSYGRVVAAATNGGKYGYSLSYSQSAVVSNNPNTWATKTVVTAPDGTTRTYYYNNAASLLLQMVTDTSGNFWYPICRQFDSNQRIVASISSSAVGYINESNPNLFTLNGNGQIETYAYDANGNKIQEAVQNGPYGALIVTKTWTYGVQTVVSGGTSISIYPMASQTVYCDVTGATLATTSFSYTWQSNGGNPSFQIASMTTTLPVISTSQNGTGVVAIRTDYYTIYGLLDHSVDEVGTLTQYAYGWTGNWTGGAGGWGVTSKAEDPSGLNLITTYEYDALGRKIQELGPLHSVSLGGVATSIQRAQWMNYQDTYLQVQTINGYVSGGVSTVENPIHVKLSYSDGVVGGTRMEQEYAAAWTGSGLPTPSTTFTQSSYLRWSTKIISSQNELTSSQLYYLIPSSGYGTQGVNFAQTSYGYDGAGRQNQVTSPGGTITQKSFNALGWLLQTSVGTTLANLLSTEILTYDNGIAGKDGNITTRTVTVDVNSADNRITYYSYDWRDRVTQTQASDGTRNIFRVMSYDNRDNVIEVDEFYSFISNATLQNKSTTSFDALNRRYQTQRFGVTLGTGVIGSALRANTYYDPTGRVVVDAPAGENDFNVMAYDSIGRLLVRYRAYGVINPSTPGNISAYTVVEQWRSTYDAASNLISAINAQRFDNAPTTGAGSLGPLGTPSTQPKARVYYMAHYPDPLGRVIATANYGTNGTSAWSRASTIPASSATVLVTGFVFDNTGEQVQVIDPLGTVTQFGYDAAGRRTQVIENYGSGASLNKTSNFAYNDDGNLTKLTAVNAVTGNQVTQWTYGVTTASGSAINSNAFLSTKTFPDSTQIGYHVNRQGQVIWMSDQLGTLHAYSYDLFGRLTQDTITQFGTGVDTTVKQIVRTYESRGMLQSISSYSGSSVLNQAQMVYDSFSQLASDYQAHSGAVNTLSTPSVQYASANGSGGSNTIRLTTLTYPNGRQLTYDYGTSGGINDVLNRVASLDQSGSPLAAYTYLGSSTIVQANYAEPNIALTYINRTGSGDAGDQYTGLDRFGRVVDNQWLQGSSVIDRIDYGYDRASNRLYRQNLVASGEDELYAYDGLYQLGKLQRGTLNGTKTAITGTPNWEEDFTLDPSGNWTNYETLVSGTPSLNQSRTQNASNEILSLSGTSVVPGYNVVGNMVTTTVPGNWSSGYNLVWDAWNRLTQVKSGSVVVATYGYDGLNRRITQVTASQSNDYYYSKDWQILQENSSSTSGGYGSGGSSSSNAYMTQYVWGQRGVDDVVLRDATTSFTQRLYALRDVMHVTAITSSTGIVLETYDYDAYGNTRVNGTSSNVSFYNWNVRYCSYLFDQESGFYQVRNRYLHPFLGRWLSRDPYFDENGFDAEITQGNNLYWYVSNNPVNGVDSLGLLQDCDEEYKDCMTSCMKQRAEWPWENSDNNPAQNKWGRQTHCNGICYPAYLECEAENEVQRIICFCEQHPTLCALLLIILSRLAPSEPQPA